MAGEVTQNRPLVTSTRKVRTAPAVSPAPKVEGFMMGELLKYAVSAPCDPAPVDG
jgi:hypothetical protein